MLANTQYPNKVIQGDISENNQVWSRKGNEIHTGYATSENLID